MVRVQATGQLGVSGAWLIEAMSSSLLERARGFHEDLEIYERGIIEQLETKPRTQKVGGSAAVLTRVCGKGGCWPPVRLIAAVLGGGEGDSLRLPQVFLVGKQGCWSTKDLQVGVRDCVRCSGARNPLSWGPMSGHWCDSVGSHAVGRGFVAASYCRGAGEI